MSLAALGDLSLNSGDAKAARGWYEKALAINPVQPEASIGEARVLSEAGDFSKAAELLEQVVANDPTNSTAHFRFECGLPQIRRAGNKRRRNSRLIKSTRR